MSTNQFTDTERRVTITGVMIVVAFISHIPMQDRTAPPVGGAEP